MMEIQPPRVVKNQSRGLIRITMNQIQLLVIVQQCIATYRGNIHILGLLLKMSFILIH